MWWHVVGFAITEATDGVGRSARIAIAISSTSGAPFVDRRHGILKRTSGGEMLARTDPTFDLLVLQLLLQAALLRLIVLLVGPPVHARSKDDVLANAGRVQRRSRRMALLQSELGPRFSLRHSRIHTFLNDRRPDLARRLHLLSIVVESERDHRLGPVFVANHLLRRKYRGVVKVFIVGPVVTTAVMLVRGQKYAGLANIITLLFSTSSRRSLTRMLNVWRNPVPAVGFPITNQVSNVKRMCV